jgi:hypothetical protein
MVAFGMPTVQITNGASGLNPVLISGPVIFLGQVADIDYPRIFFMGRGCH